jgi:hypothetical protein
MEQVQLGTVNGPTQAFRFHHDTSEIGLFWHSLQFKFPPKEQELVVSPDVCYAFDQRTQGGPDAVGSSNPAQVYSDTHVSGPRSILLQLTQHPFV